MAGEPITLRPVWVAGKPSLGQITEDVCRPLSARPTAAWFACFAVAQKRLYHDGIDAG